MSVPNKPVRGMLTARLTLLILYLMCVPQLNEGVHLFDPSEDQTSIYESEAEWISTKGLSRSNDEEPIEHLPDEAFLPKIESIYIKSKIRFRYARTRIISTLTNPSFKKSQIVNFSFRIPREAFITRFEMRVEGEEPYKANITRVEEAREMYKIAKAEGRSVTLGLLENENDSFEDFSLKFIIGAKKTLLFKLVYEERLQRKFDTYEHFIHVVPEYLSNKTTHRIEILIEENELAKNVMAFNPNRETDTPLGSCEKTYGSARVEITKDNITRLVWETVDENGTQTCHSWSGEFGVTYSLEDINQTGHVLVRNGYFVHFFAPPNLKPLRKHVVFVLDKSDSMDGSKLTQLKDAMTNILDSLRLHDYFNLIAFSNDVEVWSKFTGRGGRYLYPYPANEECKDSARYWVNERSSGGSTNIHLALMSALELCRNVSSVKKDPTPVKYGRMDFLPQTLPEGVQSMIIFLTDGDPTSGIVSKPHIQRAIKLANYDLKVPIYSLAFGKEPDFYFLKSLSLKNRGFARQIYENADAELQLSDFYAEISSPVLSNVTFEYVDPSPPHFQFVDSLPGYYPVVFDGTELVIAKKFSDPTHLPTSNFSRLHVRVSGNSALGKTHYDVPVKDCRVPGVCPGDSELDDMIMEKLFVYMSLQRLTERESADRAMFTGDDLCTKYDGYDGGDYEAQHLNCTEMLKKKAVDMAVEYGFVIPGTAAVMKTRSILEDELDVSTYEGEEWEIFVGSEIPAAPGSKQIFSKPSVAEMGERYITPERLPQPEALSSSLVLQESHILTEQPHPKYDFKSVDRDSHNLTLEDISWLSHVDLSKPTASFSMTNRKGVSVPYTIASEGWLLEHRHALGNSHNWSSSALECRGDATRTCTHLANCILKDFCNSLAIYKESYWCPMSYGDNLYLGVCCVRSSTNSTISTM